MVLKGVASNGLYLQCESQDETRNYQPLYKKREAISPAYYLALHTN